MRGAKFGARLVRFVVGALLIAIPARADTPPSAWDIARDPAARDRWNLHVRVQRLVHSQVSDASEPLELRRDQELRLESARALLEEVDAAHSPDVRLRFDLGVVYEEIATIEQRPDLNTKVVGILAPALEESPEVPGATEALGSLVYAYAKLDRPKDELSAWRRYIPRLQDDRARVGPLMNMGEAEMRLGQLDDALVTLREGLRLCETLPNSSGVNATYALTLWDLAVALDREGDSRAAAQTATKAQEWRWAEAALAGPLQIARTVTGWDIIRDATDVFFIPEWEREWYLALGDSASAAQAPDPHDAARLWAESERHWNEYVSRASSGGNEDRWLPLARTHLAHARKAREAAEKNAQKSPAKVSPSSDTTR